MMQERGRDKIPASFLYPNIVYVNAEQNAALGSTSRTMLGWLTASLRLSAPVVRG